LFPIQAAAIFDWQAEISSSAALSSAARVPPPSKLVATQVVSIAQALNAVQKVSSNDKFPQPSIRGEALYIKISQDMYEKEMAVCKHNLRWRLVLNKGDKPYTTKDIQLKPQKLWKTGEIWSMLSLRKGYYKFFVASETYLCIVWAGGTVNLKLVVLRLFQWTKDFNMHTQRNTHAHVWIRLLELPQEYWMERTLCCKKICLIMPL